MPLRFKYIVEGNIAKELYSFLAMPFSSKVNTSTLVSNNFRNSTCLPRVVCLEMVIEALELVPNVYNISYKGPLGFLRITFVKCQTSECAKVIVKELTGTLIGHQRVNSLV